MATQAQMDRLVGKALFSAEFRALLLADPEKAARSLRYRLTEPQAARIRRLKADELAQLAATFADATDLNNYQGIGFW
jgi:predicted nucleic acid-binding protein